MPSSHAAPQILAGLLDLSFREFVTPRVARGLYSLSLAVSAGAALLVTGLALGQSFVYGGLIGLGLLASLLVLMTWIRVALEVAVVLFRIADSAAEIAEHQAVIAVNTGGGPDEGPTRRRSSVPTTGGANELKPANPEGRHS